MQTERCVNVERNWEAGHHPECPSAPHSSFGFLSGQDAGPEARPPAREQGLPEEKGQEGFLGKARAAPRRGKTGNGRAGSGGPSRTRVIGGDSRKPRFRRKSRLRESPRPLPEVSGLERRVCRNPGVRKLGAQPRRRP